MKYQVEESCACSCVDVGTVIDNRECAVTIEKNFADLATAQAALAFFSEKAKSIESEPCLIESQLHSTPTGAALQANFTFCCQAEAMIFELALR